MHDGMLSSRIPSRFHQDSQETPVFSVSMCPTIAFPQCTIPQPWGGIVNFAQFTDFSDICFRQVFVYIPGRYPMKVLHPQEFMNAHPAWQRYCQRDSSSPGASAMPPPGWVLVSCWRGTSTEVRKTP